MLETVLHAWDVVTHNWGPVFAFFAVAAAVGATIDNIRAERADEDEGD